MSKTIQMLKQYAPYNEQEKEDIDIIVKAEEIFGDILNRTNQFCHLTSSAFVINKQHTKVLSAYHNLYNSWSCCYYWSIQRHRLANQFKI